jgi:phage major head subunit gpT-like protein
MPVPSVSTNFGDLLDPRFQRIFDEEYKRDPDMLSELFTFEPNNGRNDMTWSSVGTIPDFSEFTGNVSYSAQNQGYNVTATYVEFTNGIQVERKLYDDDQHNVMNQRPKALAASAFRTRQKHGAALLNGAFNAASDFFVHTEGVALCSDSHTTTSGASTASGFDNLTTDALTAVAVASARTQARGFRGDQAERISCILDELWIPVNLYEEAYEITASSGKVDTANNNANVHQGKYRVVEWIYMTDTNNWFLMDSSLKRQSAFWVDRIPLEFAMIEDFETLVAKWRAYMRYASARVDWRWILGANVS